MPRTIFKRRVVIGALLLLAIGVVVLITGPFGDSSERSRLKLPLGKGTPAISLGERHGLILASDGSLWSWGSDFLGWPVLGLGNLTNKTTSLRRVGHDTNWVSISAGTSHNLTIKSDGTIWTWGESVQGPGVGITAINAPRPAAPGNDWKQAAAGGIHCLAVKQDGTLWAWGHNWAGSLGIASTKGSSVPLQVGSATNWTRVWASTLESVGLQADGSLWYWGDNPNPAFAQGTNQIWTPTRISPDTNWVDVGFGVNTMFAIKADGTLWAWGRGAHVYTGASDQAQDATPMRVGTDSDWRSISAAAGWWCQGLIKQDGSLWFMDASEGKPNGPGNPSRPMQFRRVDFHKDYVAYAAGATHATAAGVRGPIGVVLTPDGEVWTWGMVLGDPPTTKILWEALAARIGGKFHVKIPVGDPDPVYRDKPWQLRNIEGDQADKQ